MIPFEYSVYTIIQSDTIISMIRNNETAFTENKVWRSAYNFLQEAKSKKQTMYLVLAPAETTDYLYAYAKIENIEILEDEEYTKVTFSELRRFTNEVIPKTALIKMDGKPLSENYIRPYLLCKTSSVVKYIEAEPEIPILDLTQDTAESSAENAELLQTEFTEGCKKSLATNRYERNREARNACIKYYGAVCCVCGFDFEKVYGQIGKGFIHVHHEVEIAAIGSEYKVDPVKDLKPVCPNCHAMLHQKRPAYTVEELNDMMGK